MGANKEKQNLRFKITSQRLHSKVRYDGFTKDEVTLIKTQKKLDQIEKELNQFWARVPRKDNGIVDWDSMSDETLDYFEYITKEQEKLSKKISKLEDNGFELDKVMNMFMQLNMKSASY
jgi:peptidoglycan hydrolase CwlO-like protein